MPEFTHFDDQGRTHMVEVGEKAVTDRTARASGIVQMDAETLRRIREMSFSKGNVLEVARLAGIMAAKKTSDLIPLCHSLPLSGVAIEFVFLDEQQIKIISTVNVTAKTGVEMEALTSVTIAALTIYDMCKSVDRGMLIQQVQLDEKSGGKSGHYSREQNSNLS